MATKRAHGIDISQWQATFSPTDEHKSDIDFVILKASQSNFSDPKFENYYPSSLGIPLRGAYHYFETLKYTTSELLSKAKGKKQKGKKQKKQKKQKKAAKINVRLRDGKEQADFFLDRVKDKNFHFFALDIEFGRNPKTWIGRSQNKFTPQDIKNIKGWINYVSEKTGKPVLLYTNPNIYKNHLLPNGGEILSDLDLWLAGYPNNPNRETDNPLQIFKIHEDVKLWRFWQYSADGNNKGPAYGVGSRHIDLDVFNGTVTDLRFWLGLGDDQSGITDDLVEEGDEEMIVESTLSDVIAWLVELGQADIQPKIKSNLQREEFKVEAIQSTVEESIDMENPAEVRINIQVSVMSSTEGEPQATVEIIESEPGADTDPEPEPQDSFMVEVRASSGQNTALQSFSERDGKGKPIMQPHEPRIRIPNGSQFSVSASHTESSVDKGDGIIFGTGKRKYYLIVENSNDKETVGKYVKAADVVRV